MEELFRESELVEMADSPFRAPVVLTGHKGTTSGAALNYAPTYASAPPPVATNREKDVRSSRSPDHGNIENVFLISIWDLNGKCSVAIIVLNVFYILSKPVGVSNYLKPLATEKDWRKIYTIMLNA